MYIGVSYFSLKEIINQIHQFIMFQSMLNWLILKRIKKHMLVHNLLPLFQDLLIQLIITVLVYIYFSFIYYYQLSIKWLITNKINTVILFSVAQHRFTQYASDWGFSKMIPLDQLKYESTHELPMLEDNCIRISAIVQLIKDETGVLWHNFIQ